MIDDIKLAIFDMDGLLLDTEWMYYEAAVKAFKNNGLEINESVILKSIGANNIETSGLFKNHVCKYIPVDDIIRKAEEECVKKMLKDGVTKKKGADELFDFLDKHNVIEIVATSSSKSVAEKLLDKTGLLSRLNSLVCGDEVKKSKPHPDIFLKACEIAGVEEKNSVVFEDSINGALAAKAANIKCILVPDLVYPPKEIIDIVWAVAESLSDIPKILMQ